MSRYIDADALLDIFKTLKWDASCSIVEDMPTADAVEVKHGHWIKDDNGTYSCSVCQSWIPNEQHYYANYCLHCGAKMDEREEEQ